MRPPLASPSAVPSETGTSATTLIPGLGEELFMVLKSTIELVAERNEENGHVIISFCDSHME